MIRAKDIAWSGFIVLNVGGGNEAQPPHGPFGSGGLRTIRASLAGSYKILLSWRQFRKFDGALLDNLLHELLVGLRPFSVIIGLEKVHVMLDLHQAHALLGLQYEAATTAI